MDGFGKTELKNLGLQTALQEIFDFQAQHVIELHPALVQDTNSDQTAKECITYNANYC